MTKSIKRKCLQTVWTKTLFIRARNYNIFSPRNLTERTHPKDKDSKKKEKMHLRRKQHTYKDQRP